MHDFQTTIACDLSKKALLREVQNSQLGWQKHLNCQINFNIYLVLANFNGTAQTLKNNVPNLSRYLVAVYTDHYVKPSEYPR